MKNYRQRGDTIPFTNSTGSTIVSGTAVVLGNILAVSLSDVANGQEGEAATEGVFELPKVPAAVFTRGEKLIWDSSAGAFDDSSAVAATGDITGAAVAWAPGANNETTCLAKLTPGNTVVA